MRFKFKYPKKTKLLVFDTHKINFLLNYLKKFKYETMPVRYEEINFFILLKTFLNYKFNLKFMQNYILNFIQFVNPKIIISFIDNNIFFYQLKNYFPNLKTVVIQNGLSAQPFFDKIKSKKKLKVDYAYCWGEATSKKFKKILNSKTIKIGSMKNNLVKLKKLKKNKKRIYLISGFGSRYINNLDNPIINRSIENKSKVLRFIHDVCSQKKLPFYILKKTNTRDEEIYLKKIFKEKEYFIEKKINFASNYQVCDRNKFFISFDSAMGFEALARGARVLFLNINDCFSLHYKKFDILWGSKLPRNGAFWISVKRNNLINEKILFLLDAKEKKWRNEILKFKQFIDCHDENNIKFKRSFNKILKNSHVD
jgi:surface carbohydrate biosynthesis protein